MQIASENQPSNAKEGNTMNSKRTAARLTRAKVAAAGKKILSDRKNRAVLLEGEIADRAERAECPPAPAIGEPTRRMIDIKNGRGEITGKIELFWSPALKQWVSIPGGKI